jgi:hypothetical protein
MPPACGPDLVPARFDGHCRGDEPSLWTGSTRGSEKVDDKKATIGLRHACIGNVGGAGREQLRLSNPPIAAAGEKDSMVTVLPRLRPKVENCRGCVEELKLQVTLTRHQ